MDDPDRRDDEPVPPTTLIEVVALVAAPEDLQQIQAVLRELPENLDATVIVHVPLSSPADHTLARLTEHVSLAVSWAGEGTPVEPGRVLVCPPDRSLEVRRGATCALRDADPSGAALLTSLADVYGPRALAVVAPGTGGAGTSALRDAGGAVTAPGDDTARMIVDTAASEPTGADLLEHLSPELRTPLTMVLATLEQAMRRDDLPAGLGDDLVVAARRTRRLQRLMDTLLEVSAAEQDRLRRVASADAYRVALTDALRSLSDPAEIQAAAADMLARHLGVSRAYYAGPEEGGLVRVHRDVHVGLPSMTGVYRVSDFGDDVIDGLLSNKTLVAADVAELDLDEVVRSTWEAVAIVAVIAVPLIRERQWLGTLTVAHHEPRPWTEEEVGLVEETAERTWAAVERARAETALHAAQAQLRRYFDSNN